MATIDKMVIDKIKSLNDKFAKDDKLKDFEKISKEFEELVSKGVIRKRGNNLLSATDAHIKRHVYFNDK